MELKGKNASKHITFRAPQGIADVLEREAMHRGIPAGSLLNSILQKWASWDRHAQKMGLVPVPRELLVKIMSDADDDQIHALVEKTLEILKDSVLAMKDVYDLKRCILTLEEYMHATGMTSDHTVVGNVHHFKVNHDMGMIWSLFIRHVMERLLEQFVPDNKASFDLSEGTIVVSVELGSDWDEHDY